MIYPSLTSRLAPVLVASVGLWRRLDDFKKTWCFPEWATFTFTPCPFDICWQIQSVGADGGFRDWKSKLWTCWVFSPSLAICPPRCSAPSSPVSQSSFCPDNCWERAEMSNCLTSKHGRPFSVYFAWGEERCWLIRSDWKPEWGHSESRLKTPELLNAFNTSSSFGVFFHDRPVHSGSSLQKGHEEGRCGDFNHLHTLKRSHSYVLPYIRS